MNYTQVIAAYKQFANQIVGMKISTDSIDPTDVASLGIELADLLLPILNGINDFGISGGNIPPINANGQDLDLYIQGGASLTFWRKRVGIWVSEASVDLGIQIINGNMTLRSSVIERVVTVTPGTWAINNTIYNKPTQTQFNLSAADLNYNRIDALFANTGSAVILVAGVPSSNPAPPAIPANSVIIDYVYVPAASSGDLPYLANNNVPPVLEGESPSEVIVFDWNVAPVTEINMTVNDRQKFGSNPHIEVWISDLDVSGNGSEYLYLPNYSVIKQKTNGLLTEIQLPDLNFDFTPTKTGYILLFT